MSKRLNYYQVHKNKKPRKINNTNFDKLYKIMIAATELVKSLVGVSESMKAMSKIRPYYVIGAQSHPEIIIDKHGKEVELSGEGLSTIVRGNSAKCPGEEYKRIIDEIKNLKPTS